MKRPDKEERGGMRLAVAALIAVLVIAALLLTALILDYYDEMGWAELAEALGLDGRAVGYFFVALLAVLPVLLFVLYKLNASPKLFRSPNDIPLRRWSLGLIVAVLFFCYFEAEFWYYTVHGAEELRPTLFVAHFLLLLLLIACFLIENARRQRTVAKLNRRIKIQSAVIAKKNAEERLRKEEAGEAGPEPRFSALLEIDARAKTSRPMFFDEDVTLGALCEQFRAFAAGKLGLYYDISDIRKFVAGMAVSRIVILQGMSGTGKTSLAYAFGQFLDSPAVVVPVQPMWKERTDLLGYYNEFTKRFNETPLLQTIYEANYSKGIHVAILDEMNIARVEYYFAEFLSLLEIPDPEARYLEVVSDRRDGDPALLKDGKLKLPDNLWFIGTANNDDSTFAISDKVYDRAMVLDLDAKTEPFAAEEARSVHVSAAQFDALARSAQEGYEMTGRDLRRIAMLDGYLSEKFRISFGNRIMKQIKLYIPVYAACGGDETEALDDIIAKKVLRKLEALNAVYIKSMAEELCDYLDDLFGYDRMPSCKDYVRRLKRNA